MKRKTGFCFIITAALFFCLICLSLPASASAGGYNAIKWADVQRTAVSAVAPQKGVYISDNIRWGFADNDPHKPLWKRVSINSTRVRNVYFFLKPFPPEWLVAHAFLLFEFDDDSPMTASDGARSRGIILSVEPKYRFGRSYGTAQTENPMYIVYQLSSREDYLQVCAIEKTKALFPFRLGFTREQASKLLANAIAASCNNVESANQYDLFKNNCINNLFDLFNTVLIGEKKFRKNFFKSLANPRVSTPQLCVRTLRSFSLVTQALPPVKNIGAPVKLEGAELERSMAKAKEIQSTVDRLSASVLHAVDTGVMNKDIIKTMLYNADADYAVWMHVPGVVPGSAETGEFFVGREFIDAIDSAKNDEQLKLVIISTLRRFKAAIATRMLFPGQSLAGFVGSNVNRIHNSVTKYINAACMR
jgi:hypothetical protein